MKLSWLSVMMGLVCSLGGATSLASENVEAQYKIRWILAHQPARVFERAAKHFADSLKEQSGGKISVTIVDASSFQKDGLVSPHKAFEMVQNGQLEMTQTYTTALGKYNRDLWVVDLPFLFRSHEHAAKTLDGPVGQRIMAGLEKHGVQGLGFTYSGGYRVIPSVKPIASVNDFKGMKVRVTNDSPVAAAYMKELGATVVQIPDAGAYGRGATAFETTYPRLADLHDKESKYITETEHSLFLTTIVINKKFMESLPKDMQKMVLAAANKAAQMERDDSIADGKQARDSFEKAGLKIARLPASEVSRMQQAGLAVEKKFTGYFSPELISSIKAVQ